MNKIVIALIAIIIVGASGWYVFFKNPTAMNNTAIGANDTVATVNGTIITRGQLTASESSIAAQQGVTATSTEVLAQFQADALNLLIGKILLEQTAMQAGFIASSTEVDTQIAAAKAQFNNLGDYEKALTTQGMTEDSLRLQISQNLVISAYLQQQLNLASTTATEAEIKTTYDQIASQQTGTTTPSLAEVYSQVEQMVLQQKQQASINAYVTQLRSAADVQILIATSTPKS